MGASHEEEHLLAATLLQSPSNAQKTNGAEAAPQEPEETANRCADRQNMAAEVSKQDKVTKVNSNVVMVEFTQHESESEEADEVRGPTRSSKRKATPWHKGGAAAVNFDEDESDDENDMQDKLAVPEQPSEEPVKRKAERKATPWHKGGEVPESELDEDEGQDEKEQINDKDESPGSGGLFCFLALCTRPCIPQEEVV